MGSFFWILIGAHVLVSLLLVLLVLVQNDKGGGLSGAFGGGNGGGGTFSGTGAATFISKLTRYIAFGFMAIVLVINWSVSQSTSVQPESKIKQAVSGLGAIVPSAEPVLQTTVPAAAPAPAAAPVEQK